MRQGEERVVALGSENPVKVRVAEAACGEALGPVRVVPVRVPSGVGEQPRSDEETLRGALQRARAARAAVGAPFGIGIESGVARLEGGLFAFTWVAVCDGEGRVGRACSARLELPAPVAEAVEGGAALEAAIEQVLGVRGAGRGDGAMGLATGGRVTRFDAALQAARFALSPWAPGALFGP